MINLETLVEAAMDKVLLDIKESIGLPFQVDPLPLTFHIKTPYLNSSIPY